ncbi:DUF2946 domain-containing protein [Stieleria varia]|nr:DUF2946 domain-containing protein [Stieleria varia]
MTSFVRPFVISLLCGMAVFGHAPAWLHVAGCDHESHSQVASESVPTTSVSCQHHCCHHAASAVEDAAEDVADSGPRNSTSEHSGHSHDGHDSGSCMICQSLGMPNGIAWQLDSPTIHHDSVERIGISGVLAPESTSLSIPQPRGPPTPLA